MTTTPERPPAAEGRSARKRREIITAASSVFLQHGYRSTSVDEIAALASVSKQTVYKHFTDKENLFAAVISGTAEPNTELDQVFASTLARAQDPAETAPALEDLARAFVSFLVRPEVRQLRRLVIAEAGRFPELGRGWYQRGFERGMAALADCLGRLAEQGRLRVDDPTRAANHFSGLVLWVPVNRVMFCGDEEQISEAEIDRYAKSGVHAFLAAYGAG